jgi:putative ABC transport system permease protein
MAMTATVVLFAARNIRRVNPINALRGETSVGRVAKKNRLALDRNAAPLSALLGLKSTIQNPRQTMMIAIIMIAVSFAGVFGVIMYYNSAVDTKSFAKVPGNEIGNVIVAMSPASNKRERIVDEIRMMDKVRKVEFDDEATVIVDGIVVPAMIRSDFSTKEYQVAYVGRYPENSGEITLHGSLADKLGKQVGDTVTLTAGRVKLPMRIVGLQSGMNGFNASVLDVDYVKLDPQFVQTVAYVYLEEGTDAAKFTADLAQTYRKDDVIEVLDGDKLLAEGMSSYQDIIAIMGLLILIIMICVIALVLYFVISASIVRRRRELGIHKAIGFSTLQLMNQFSVSFMIPVVFGVAAGALLGGLYTNTLLATAVAGGGVIMPDFLVNPAWIAVFALLLIATSYALALLITWRIRKISAYALVTE